VKGQGYAIARRPSSPSNDGGLSPAKWQVVHIRPHSARAK